jgi:hypothetical protein
MELRHALVRLVAYLALLATMGYGGYALMNGPLIGALAAADQRLEWTKPRGPAGAYHPSLPPKLRGIIEEGALRR